MTDWRMYESGVLSEGLRFLLRGGFRYTPGRGLTLVVRGPAGSGKSLFIADLVMNGFWRAGARVAFFDLDQGITQTQTLIRAVLLGRGHTEVPGFPHGDRFDFHQEGSRQRQGLQELVDKVATDWPDASESQTPQGIIVVDSINGVEDAPFERSQFAMMQAQVVGKGHWFVVSSEDRSADDRQHPWLDYVADILICLDSRERLDYKARTIEIVKYRNAYHVRGAHPFVMRGVGEGGIRLCIYPSLASKLRWWIKGSEEERDRPLVRLGPGIDGLDKMLGGGVPAASSTAYVGLRASKKTPCALHFAVRGMAPKRDRQGPQKRTLVVSLGVGHVQLASIASDYEVLHSKLLASPDKREFDKALVHFHYVPPGYITAEKLIADIEELIKDREFDGAIISDLRQVQERFPLLEDDPLLVAALARLFYQYDVTSLFVETVPALSDEGSSIALPAKVAMVVDNVVEFRHLFFYGADHLGVTVRRRHGAQAESGFRELKTEDVWDERAERHRSRIALVRSLEGFTDLFSGVPRAAPVTLFLYEENDIQRSFNQYLVSFLEAAFPGLGEAERNVRRFGPRTASSYLSGIHLATPAPQPDIRVAMVDEFWRSELRERLARMPREMLDRMRDRFVEGDEETYPHYLNVGLMVALGSHACSIAERVPERGVPTWDDLLGLSADLERDGLLEEGRPFFDFDRSAPESWSCMLLEILASSAPQTPDEDLLSALVSDDGVAALASFHKVFWRHRARQASIDQLCHDYVRPEEAVWRKTDQQPVFRRCWYTNLAQYFGGFGTGSCRDVRTLPLPGGRSTAGEWYWGVIAGGASEEIGWKLVEWLSSEEVNARKYSAGVGLPAEKRYYEEDAAYPSLDPACSLSWVKGRLWHNPIRRTKIKKYATLSPVLSQFLLGMLLLDPLPPAELPGRIKEMAQRAYWAATQAQTKQ